MPKKSLIWLIPIIFISSCSPAIHNSPGLTVETGTPTGLTPLASPTSANLTSTPDLAATAEPSPTPQSHLVTYPGGPDAEQFPTGTNPLSGLQVQDPSMLALPAVLVSISNMPPTARPQAGLSFAPFVYELFIGEGTTRFMSVFYGDLPRRIPNDQGACGQRPTTKLMTGPWIGRRIWLDENRDGIQNAWEAGVGGICIKLMDDKQHEIASTSTDSNGYYAFDSSGLQVGSSYTLRISLPAAYQFTLPEVGNADQDSDANPATGEIKFTYSNNPDKSLNAGLVLVNPGPVINAVSEIAPNRTYVGPIRSGRLTYNDFTHMYPASCLVYASAGDGIRQQLDGCEIIFGEQPGLSPNTALLDVSHLKELAQKSKLPNQPVNYSGNLFDTTPPAAGQPANSLWTYFHA